MFILIINNKIIVVIFIIVIITMVLSFASRGKEVQEPQGPFVEWSNGPKTHLYDLGIQSCSDLVIIRRIRAPNCSTTARDIHSKDCIKSGLVQSIRLMPISSPWS